MIVCNSSSQNTGESSILRVLVVGRWKILLMLTEMKTLTSIDSSHSHRRLCTYTLLQYFIRSTSRSKASMRFMVADAVSEGQC